MVILKFDCTLWYLFPLVINSLLLFWGVAMVSCGIAERNAALETAPESRIQPDQDEKPTSLGAVSISIGSVASFIGLFGLYCVFSRIPLFQFIYLCLLVLSIMGYLVLLIVYTVAGNESMQKMEADLKDSIRKGYGNDSNEWSKRVTAVVNEYHQEMKCCGWNQIRSTGNIYLETPWYTKVAKRFNTSRTTLPDSCCQVEGDECTAVENIQEARDKGFVHPVDCMDRVKRKYDFGIRIVTVEVLVTCIIQLPACIFTLLHLVRA